MDGNVSPILIHRFFFLNCKTEFTKPCEYGQFDVRFMGANQVLPNYILIFNTFWYASRILHCIEKRHGAGKSLNPLDVAPVDRWKSGQHQAGFRENFVWNWTCWIYWRDFYIRRLKRMRNDCFQYLLDLSSIAFGETSSLISPNRWMDAQLDSINSKSLFCVQTPDGNSMIIWKKQYKPRVDLTGFVTEK